MKLNKYLRPFLAVVVLLFLVFTNVMGQTNTVILTSGTSTWKPPAGCTSYYVHVWGGGAGGNTSSMGFCCSFQNGYGGGTGASFSRSNVIAVTDAARINGYSYNVGLGGSVGNDGGASNFDGVWAAGGVTNGKSRQYYTGGDIAFSSVGGFGGLSFKSISGVIGQGGGGGSPYASNGSYGNGQDGGDANYNGTGGSGEGSGGRNQWYFPSAPGGGGAGNQAGARGEIRIYWNCGTYSPGSIGNAHTVPFAQEFSSNQDFITNVVSATQNVGLSYSWEDSSQAHNWQTISGATGASFAIPAIEQDTYYRRVVDGCKPNKADNVSNTVLIKVFSLSNGKKNGTISGKVVSKNGVTGVAGIIMQAKRTTPVKGSPDNYTYVAGTDGDGNYQFQNLFYGDAANGDPGTVSFVITPVKAGHTFTPATRTISLSNTNPSSAGNNFTDNTVYSISGKVTQTCNTCLPGFQGPFGVGNVTINPGPGILLAKTDSLNANTYGQYSITVENPIQYTFTPSYLNHSFSPSSSTFTVSADITGKDFADATTRTISGKLSDVANNYIGTGTLVFQGYNKVGNTMVATFKKTATVAASTGIYSITLPAGKYYKVSVQDFTPAFPSNDPKYVAAAELLNFFNVLAFNVDPYIEIDTANAVRNLVYHRPPVIEITGLTDTTCNINDASKNPGLVFKSSRPRNFQLNVYEGPPSLNNRIATSDPLTVANGDANPNADFIRFYTNVTKMQATANADTMYWRLNNVANKPMLDSFITAGAPNTVAPYTKTFEIHYIDRYGRKATPIVRKTTVTGVFNPTSTFTTAFPEKPYLILHAPPGDQSYSYWSKDSVIETASSFATAKTNSDDGFLNVSVAPTFSLSQGPVSIEFAVIASANFNHEHTVTTTTENELIQSTTTTTTFQTEKSGVADSTSGDVYVGGALNYILGKSIFVDFDENQPAGNCQVISGEKLVMAPKGFKTEFAYTEEHIVNTIIPQLQAVADDNSTTQARRDSLINQISVWQQVIENNNKQKKAAEFKLNRSFSNGVVIDESQTGSLSSINTLTYNVEISNSIAFELGLYIAGAGASGGANITIQETTGNSIATNNTKATTMGYHLQDDDPGDYFSVDIKKDPVYGTPVFDLVAGTSSCPPEAGAQNRDQPQIISGDMRFENLDPAVAKFFTITLTNKSESGEARFYNLSVDGTTSEGVTISSSGSSNLVTNAIPFYLAYGESKDVQIKVEKFNKNDKVLSYPNVEFYLADNCANSPFIPNSYNTAKISFNFLSACGGITLATPADGWIANAQNGNSVPVTMSGYTLANIDSVTLQYAKKGTNIWKNGFSVKKAGINDPNSFTYPWNITSVTDSVYEMRLKLVCLNQDVIYSDAVTGVIDRRAPFLVGKPLPGAVYTPGASEISFSYNETIDDANINSGNVELMNWTSKAVVPVTVIANNGKLIIKPVSSLSNTQDSFRVIVNNVTDLFGNNKQIPDTSFFRLGSAPVPVYTGNNRATIHIINPSLPENTSGKIELHFKLWDKLVPERISKIYFNVSGTATFGSDYDISYDTIRQKKCATQACNSFVYYDVLNEFNGTSGYVNIDSGKKEAIIYIDPVEDVLVEGNETIKINLVAGGDYKLQDSVSATATIIDMPAPCPPAGILYVNKNATGNRTGADWANACISLQDALSFNCPSVTQIWVAKGTYKPTTDFNRDSAFVMRNNLAIYGGFAGTEALLSQRNYWVNPTILSGDIGSVNNFADNSYNVIRNNNNGLNATAILDGFTITGGNANKAEYVRQRGGGVHNRLSAPAFYNCVFAVNQASAYGGGMFNEAAAVKVVNSVFAGDSALYGGGLYNESAATELVNCTFSGNTVFTTGAAMYTYGAVIPKVTNSIMWGNKSGIQNAGGATPLITNSIVQPNNIYLPQDSIFVLKPAPGFGNTGDLRLRPCSPAINAGTNASLPVGTTLDLAGNTRIVQTTVDIGAYERQSTGTIVYVDSAAKGNNDGTSWVDAYTSIYNAINDLNQCENTAVASSINVARGTYTVPAEINPALLNRLNAIILGGYPSGGGSRNAAINKVKIISNFKVLKSAQVDGVTVVMPSTQ